MVDRHVALRGFPYAPPLTALQVGEDTPPEWVGIATPPCKSAGRYPEAHGIFRRILDIQRPQGEHPLCDPKAAVQS